MRRALLLLCLTCLLCTSFNAGAIGGEAAGLPGLSRESEPARKKRKKGKKQRPQARSRKANAWKKKREKKQSFFSRFLEVGLSIPLFGGDDGDCDEDDMLLSIQEKELYEIPSRKRGKYPRQYPGILKSGRVGM